MSPPDAHALDSELQALGEAVRAARPRPRAVWAEDLDDRVAAGFPRPHRKRRRLSLPRPTLLIPALGAVACLLIAVAVAVPLVSGDGHEDSATKTSQPLSAATTN